MEAAEVPAAKAAEPKKEEVWVEVAGDEMKPTEPESRWASWEDDWDDDVEPVTEGLASRSSSSSGNKGCKGGAGRGAFRGGYGGGHYDSEHSLMQVFEADHRLQFA